ncbi:sulfite exporter TauE/SafE family protein [Permianibacter fluminis]|uniref:sulfite exporter TauE/SafE family protein n=1 Tax=Permianibacter fluminis TaxID=2738515 RepID=UPI001B7D8978|nr:sulfite exporter TauE/SafE family protein [Permianibacter fluminis]
MELAPEFTTFVLIGLLAQLIKGALGMAYGVTSSGLLLGFGHTPAIASVATHIAEVFTSGASWASHVYHGNVKKRLLWRLVLPGVVGALLGASVLSYFSSATLKPWVSAYLLLMGVWILARVWRKQAPRPRVRGAISLGLGAGFLDALGGGGWGSLTTTQLIAQGVPERYAIGTVQAAEFFVAVAAAVVFIAVLGIGHWQIPLGLLVGSMIAAPFATYVLNVLPVPALTASVGSLTVLLSVWNFLR